MDRTEKYSSYAGTGFWLYVGLSSLGRGINNEFLTSHSSTFGMLGLYSFYRIGKSRKRSLVESFLAASVTEVLQGGGFLLGTYDPKDFLGYAIGASACFALDSIRFKRNNLESSMD